MRSDFKVDIVIPWVDGNDPAWKREKEQYAAHVEKNEGNGESRYRDWGLMKYWFRSIEQNARWVNRIHFVTYGHLPAWLDVTNEKIHVVRHHEYIPSKYLPTFNANTIELNIHRINGLAERFIYMNDDTFIMNKVNRDFFWDRRGYPRQMMKVMCLDNYNPDVDFCLINFNDMGLINRNFSVHDFPKRRLFSRKYGLKTNIRNLVLPLSYVYPGFGQLHMPAPFLKSTFEEVWEKEQGYLDRTCLHKFRHYKDVNQWLMQYWQLVKGDFSPMNVLKYSKMYEIGTDDEKMYYELKRNKYQMACLNDSDGNIDFEKEKRKLTELMEKLFPAKSSYEKEIFVE